MKEGNCQFKFKWILSLPGQQTGIVNQYSVALVTGSTTVQLILCSDHICAF